MKLKQMVVMFAVVAIGTAARGADGDGTASANPQRDLAPGGGKRFDL